MVKRFLVAVFMGLFLTSPAQATSDEVMLDMIEYIVDNSKYTYEGQKLPFIQILTPEEIHMNITGKDYDPEAPTFFAGYFDHNMNTVYISSESGPFKVDEKFIETVLIHELVHFLQWENGWYDKVACQAALERDAFEIQRDYVEVMGFPEEQKPDPLFSMMVSMCPPDGHLHYE